uniref:ATP synthase epsilon chain n=1 Tax=Dictyoglomus thermophilum TaxID=14 RepID=A0A7C3MRU3_DICTH
MKEDVKKEVYLEIVTPVKVIYRGYVNSIIVPVEDGMIGILPRHVNTLARIIPGILISKTDKGSSYFVVGKGFMEFIRDKAYVITDNAEIIEKIDFHTLEKEEKELREKLKETPDKETRDEIKYALLLNSYKKRALQLFLETKDSTK